MFVGLGVFSFFVFVGWVFILVLGVVLFWVFVFLLVGFVLVDGFFGCWSFFVWLEGWCCWVVLVFCSWFVWVVWLSGMFCRVVGCLFSCGGVFFEVLVCC